MDSDIREGFGFLLNEATQAWRLEIDRRLAPRGLSQATWRALFHLKRRGEGLTQRQLAENMGIEGPSLVRLIDHLERADLVERRAAPLDRRCNHLFLTDKGRELLNELLQIASVARAELLDGIDEEAIRTTLATLRHLIDNASQLKSRA